MPTYKIKVREWNEGFVWVEASDMDRAIEKTDNIDLSEVMWAEGAWELIEVEEE